MPDLVLVNSPIHDYSRYPRYTSSYSTPVGLLYVATAAREAGFDVTVLDAEEKQLTPAEIAGRINAESPRTVGFNVFSINFSIVETITAMIDREITVVAGGPHVSTMRPAHFSSRLRRVDVLVRNDGEEKIVEILKGAHPVTVPGVYFRDALGAIVVTGEATPLDLDELPVPDRSFLATEPYLRDDRRWMDISISRGCVFTCKFCAGSCKSNGTVYRRRSTPSIRRELRDLIPRHRLGGIQIVDDLPFNGHADLEEFLDLVDREHPHLQWEVNFPLQFLRSLSPDQITRMARSGITRLSFGIESGSFTRRRTMGKLAKDDDLFRLTTQLSGAGISVKGYFIIGFPGESREEMHLTVDLAERLHATTADSAAHMFRPRLFMYKPMPGSALWTTLLTEGHSEEDMLSYADFHVDADYFKKHAWGTAAKYSQVDPAEIQSMINAFYATIGDPSA
ncbi:B12-binding domain-containing radical SAM protein [Sphaerisporangium aureirubrum]|uniref:B12-binding domain-containing radical SAM protein n=1 Tax=Sphaerisporangium aureirubrum TaxID=1544736 RepID=A0ABW1NKK0_9ACTN